ncbi:MAG: ABC transporter ATP-binding protein [Anaerolineales bacterium]|nr:ABC transporter ATP-binding protein [Anaerolineales bacterium]MCB9128400.1 ABC transporter ATP-binding protein [Ardenticatenales bacterium]
MSAPNDPHRPFVEARDIWRTLPLGDKVIEILRGISLSVAAGEAVALTGPSGSGKSTLLGIIAGLDSPSSGQILIDGTDITQMGEGQLARLRNQKVGVVFQSFNLIPTLTALENVALPLYVHRERRHATQRARELLARVGLSDRSDHRPNQLSGGQQQRVAIARALATAPALVVADEPTGNLDSHSSAQILDLFDRLRHDLALTLIVATHDPRVAARADRVHQLVDGRFVAAGGSV